MMLSRIKHWFGLDMIKLNRKIIYIVLCALALLSCMIYAQQTETVENNQKTSLSTKIWHWLSGQNKTIPAETSENPSQDESVSKTQEKTKTSTESENVKATQKTGREHDKKNQKKVDEKNKKEAGKRIKSSQATVVGKPVQKNGLEQQLKNKPEKKSKTEVQIQPVKQKIDREKRPEENKKLLESIKQHQKEVVKLCEEIGNLLGSVSVKGCLSHNFSHGKAYSVKGRALVYKDIYPNGVSADQANKLSKVLVIGGIHGDEYSAFSIIFRWLERLGGDKQNIQQYWRFIPAANPDGLLSFQPAQRMNANGVDLNRNFLTNDWRDKAIEYWETKTGKDARRNPGKTAASEPETIWLSGLIEQWQPDVIVSVHAPYGILDFDSTDRVDIRAPNKIGMLHLKLLGTYPGSLGRYAALNRGIPVLTMELPHAGIMPSKSEQEHLWQDLQKWLNENI